MMRCLTVVAVFAVGCGGGLSLGEFQTQVDAAKACDVTVGDTCRNAGGSQCLCATPVNSAKAADVDRIAQSISCGSSTVRCAPMLNPRCANGTCVADIQ
jgi:hypothetical protein